MRSALVAAAGVPWQQWRAETILLAGLHDVGKADCHFQNLSAGDCDRRLLGTHSIDPRHGDAKRYKRHAYTSFLLVWDAAANWGACDNARLRAGQIVGGHHGVIPVYNRRLDRRTGADLLNTDEAVRESLRTAREQLLATVRHATGGNLCGGDFTIAAASISLAVVSLADWLVSQTSFLAEQSKECGWIVDDPGEWYVAAERRCRGTTLLAAGITKPAARPVKAKALLPPGAEPSGLQLSVERDHPIATAGITFIKAPTGDGKTEAALLAATKYALARGQSGWYFAMPTRGSADGLYDRLARLLPHLDDRRDVDAATTDLRRVHGLAGLHEVTTHAGDDGRVWLSGNRKALLAPFGVGTVDQALMGAMRVKHSPVRMLGIGTGCLILDEAHSYSWYTGELMKRLVAWMGALRGAVVILSATMPQNLISDLASAYQQGTASHLPKAARPESPPTPRCAYPGWAQWQPAPSGAPGPGTWTARSAEPQRGGWRLSVEIRYTPPAALSAAMATEALAAVEGGGCVLVVRETVAKAQQTYDQALASDPGDCAVILAHSRFRHRDRSSIEQQIAGMLGPPSATHARPERLIVVSTQVVETSLDVDFDFVISDPAPIGALIQRAGRAHRHPGRSRPAAHSTPRIAVFWPRGENGKASYQSQVYMPHDLRSCLGLLDEYATILVPDDVPSLVDRAAESTPPGDAGEAAWIEWLADADIQKGHAKESMAPDPTRSASLCLADLTGPWDDDQIAPTRLGAPTVLVLPVYETAGGPLSAIPGGPPLPNEPTAEQERQLVEACIPVPRLPRQSRWLSLLEDPPTAQGRRTAWTSGPLAAAKLLRCDRLGSGEDRSIVLEDQQVWISPTRGLDAEQLST